MQRRYDVRCNVHCRNALICTGSVSRPSGNMNAEFVCRRHHLSFCENDGARMQIIISTSPGINVESHCGIHFRILQYSFVNHALRSLKQLLCRLEHELYRSLQFRFMLLQNSGRTQKHRCMAIVTTAVAHAIFFAAVFHSGIFLLRQSIHIRPQENHRAGSGSNHTGKTTA